MVYKEIALFADGVLMIDVPYPVCTLACSKRSDSGERCEVKKAMKSRGGLEREVPSLTLSSIFSRSFLLRTALHYLNARNWLFVHALWCFKILNTRV